jgi:hypothetical protein
MPNDKFYHFHEEKRILYKLLSMHGILSLSTKNVFFFFFFFNKSFIFIIIHQQKLIKKKIEHCNLLSLSTKKTLSLLSTKFEKKKKIKEDGNELINVRNVKRISTCCWSETLDRISHCET